MPRMNHPKGNSVIVIITATLFPFVFTENKRQQVKCIQGLKISPHVQLCNTAVKFEQSSMEPVSIEWYVSDRAIVAEMV